MGLFSTKCGKKDPMNEINVRDLKLRKWFLQQCIAVCCTHTYQTILQRSRFETEEITSLDDTPSVTG
jgi:hypothetical protein